MLPDGGPIWSSMLTKTPEEISWFLASPDVAVTNKKDKAMMLAIVGKTDEHVREMVRLW
jgi:hypothetical protein